MLYNLKIQFQTRKAELVQLFLLAAGCYALGMLIMTGVNLWGNAEENVPIGTLIAMVAMAFTHFFCVSFSFIGEFNMAISMGATRKAFVGSYTVFTVAEIALFEFILFVFGCFEQFLLGKAFPQNRLILDVTAFFTWKNCLSVLIAFTVMELFVAAVILRFGMKAFWTLWIVYMLIAFLPAKLSENEALVAKFHQFSSEYLIRNLLIVAVVALIAMAVATWRILRRQ